jgi:hypothetical protein
MGINFESAKQIHEENPDTFNWAGIDALKQQVRPGCYVKVCETSGSMPERFWVKVVGIRDDKIDGVVWNNLVWSPLKHGDEVTFYFENVYDIYFSDVIGSGDEKENIRGVHATCN